MGTTIPYAEHLGDRDALAVLRSTVGRIQDLIEGLNPQQLSSPPQPGKWSIHQIIGHLADTELVGNVRFRMMLFEDRPALAAYDQERWMQGWLRENEAFEATLERFRVIRDSTVLALENAPRQDLQREGIHGERGVITSEQYAITLAGHDINHLRQIEGIRNL